MKALPAFLSLFLATPFALAQTLGPGPSPVQYIVAPETPGPESSVNIEAQGVGDFLGNASITWTLDGKKASSGTGDRTFSFTTGALGKKSTVSVSIDSQEYGLITHTFSFNLSRVNLSWEAETTVPPFYAGRSLYSAGSRLKVVAFPEVFVGGSAASASSLSYRWQRGGQAQPAASGLGRSSYEFDGDQLHPFESVSVDVYSGTATVGHADIDIPVEAPLVLFYAHDPLAGIRYEHSLQDSYPMNTKESVFRAEPYFFSLGSAARGALQFSWQLNGKDATGPNAQNGEMTLRQTGSGGGTASLSVSVQNNDTGGLLQAAQNGLAIIFGQAASQGQSAFGL